MHWHLNSSLRPYIGTLRPYLITVAWFLIPLLVYLYQNVIMKGAATRVFLAPLNDRGQLGQPSATWAMKIRHCVDAAIVAPVSITLFGPVLDSLFWLAIKLSEGDQCTIRSKKSLAISTLTISYWYLTFMSNGWKFTTWYYFFAKTVTVAAIVYTVITEGPTAYGLVTYVALLFNIWVFQWTVRRMRKDKQR